MATFDDSRQEEQTNLLRAKEEEDLARILSQKYGVSYADLSQQSINVDALRLLSADEARTGLLAPFERVDKRLSVAVKSPENDATKNVLAKLAEQGYEVKLYMTSMASLERAWSRYRELDTSTETHAGVLDVSPEALETTLTQVNSLADIRKLLTETLHQSKVRRISSILETVLAGGIKLSASDVHAEPEEQKVRLRFRLDGILTDVADVDRETYNLLLSRIKLLSGLKLNVREEAQDGRFSVKVRGEDIEVRSSVLPGAYGESVVMRLLDPKTIQLPMEKLGIDSKLFALLEHEIKRPNGMLLNTGPTGSGKTTTLYAFLRKIHTADIKIITIEDPVEYHLQGVVQTQVDHDKYTFESGLRSALRQDPDVIMVGEIRDSEVAGTAINAALTGHMVFSTLHTNTAAGAFPRLIDLGVNPSVIGSAVTVVMAQRLVRRIKKETAKPVELTGERKELVEKILAGITDKSLIPHNRTTVWEPQQSADDSGYGGRLGVFEAIKMDKEIEDLVSRSASEREIADAAKTQGLLTLPQDGILKVLSGETSFSELERVLDLPRL